MRVYNNVQIAHPDILQRYSPRCKVNVVANSPNYITNTSSEREKKFSRKPSTKYAESNNMKTIIYKLIIDLRY